MDYSQSKVYGIVRESMVESIKSVTGVDVSKGCPKNVSNPYCAVEVSEQLNEIATKATEEIGKVVGIGK